MDVPPLPGARTGVARIPNRTARVLRHAAAYTCFSSLPGQTRGKEGSPWTLDPRPTGSATIALQRRVITEARRCHHAAQQTLQRTIAVDTRSPCPVRLPATSACRSTDNCRLLHGTCAPSAGSIERSGWRLTSQLWWQRRNTDGSNCSESADSVVRNEQSSPRTCRITSLPTACAFGAIALSLHGQPTEAADPAAGWRGCR